MAKGTKRGSGCLIILLIATGICAALFVGFIGLVWLAAQMPMANRQPPASKDIEPRPQQAIVDRDPSAPREIEKPTRQTVVPQISDDIKQMIVDQLVLNSVDVRDVFIGQEHDDIKIAIIVRRGTTRQRAKEIGESAVRLTKSLSDDDHPGNLIGKGIYDYRIAVGTSAENIMVQGAKTAGAVSISW